MSEIKNAIIESVTINKSNGILDCYIGLDYGHSGQGFGGYCLYLPKSYKNHKLESLAGHFIYRVMEIAGVDDFSNVIGKAIRVDSEHSKVHAIGHIIKDDWFNPSKDFVNVD